MVYGCNYRKLKMLAWYYLNMQEDLDTIDRLIADAEASYNKWRHPDPYIGKYWLDALLDSILDCYF